MEKIENRNKKVNVSKSNKKQENKKRTLITMEQMISEKLEGLKFGLPLILTIITALIGFVFLEKYEGNNIFYFAIIAMILLLIAFVSILLVLIPREEYKDEPKKKNKKAFDFNPLSIKTYINLSEKEFISNLQKYLGINFSKVELIQVKLLKQKINEYRYKLNVIRLAYKILIGGAISLLIVFYIGLFIL